VPTTYRRLLPADAPLYHALRVEGLRRHPREFRTDADEEARRPIAEVAERLAGNVTIGAFEGETLVGVGTVTRESRAKLRHKMMLVGMYVAESARGTGAADGIIERLLQVARDAGMTGVYLTVIVDNGRAKRVYERRGFVTYGVEPMAVRYGDGYLDEALMWYRM
jgi:GNAT superfamily N-acetyltransferase